MSASLAASARNFIHSFLDLAKLPRAFWYIIGVFIIEVPAYYGVLTLMPTYLSSDLGWGDKYAGITVSIFTMIITLFMLGIGSYVERFGLKRAILIALGMTCLGRLIYSAAPLLGGGSFLVALILTALLIVAIGSAIITPVCYSGIKQYTDEKTNSMGYGLIYAMMNLGIVGIGALSSWLRPAVQKVRDHKGDGEPGMIVNFFSGFCPTGVQAVNWACFILTGVAIVVFFLLMTRKVEMAKLRPDTAEEARSRSSLPLTQRLREYFCDGPFSNPRFIFFIFMLLPVRTLFAHQWLTMPQYILRAYDPSVGDNMEKLVLWVNSLIIFFGVPIATALTRHINVYKMMVIGSLVSAGPTFLLCMGPSLPLLITYFVVFSIGEALWSARFLEYASELAPPGRIAQYMGLANIPWLLAKGTTGLYSGSILAHYCPAGVPASQLHTEIMWFIYGCIAMLSPIGLWMARNWVMKGLKTASK